MGSMLGRIFHMLQTSRCDDVYDRENMDGCGGQMKHAFTESLSCFRYFGYSQIVHISPDKHFLAAFVSCVSPPNDRVIHKHNTLRNKKHLYCPFMFFRCVYICAATPPVQCIHTYSMRRQYTFACY